MRDGLPVFLGDGAGRGLCRFALLIGNKSKGEGLPPARSIEHRPVENRLVAIDCLQRWLYTNAGVGRSAYNIAGFERRHLPKPVARPMPEPMRNYVGVCI